MGILAVLQRVQGLLGSYGRKLGRQLDNLRVDEQVLGQGLMQQGIEGNSVSAASQVALVVSSVEVPQRYLIVRLATTWEFLTQALADGARVRNS